MSAVSSSLVAFVGVYLGCFVQLCLVSENAFIFSDNGVPWCACLLSCEALFHRIIMIITNVGVCT